jgi:hypothetical protein
MGFDDLFAGPSGRQRPDVPSATWHNQADGRDRLYRDRRQNGGPMGDQDVVSYQGVPLGVPVLTRDGEQFGILEHVLQVPEVDVFDGIVVWTGGSKLADKYIEHELKAGSRAGAVRAEFADASGTLRFVDADQIAIITTTYIRCAFSREQVALLPPPSGACRKECPCTS